MSVRKHFDVWTLLVIAITLVLFVAALVSTGLTHDILLEAGVFLVSVKLIVMGYHLSVSHKSMEHKLDDIRSTVQQLGREHVRDGGLPLTGPPNDEGKSAGASDVAGDRTRT